MKILHDFISRMRSTAVARISNTIRARSATAVGEAKIQTPSDRLNTQERADYALVSDVIIQKSIISSSFHLRNRCLKCNKIQILENCLIRSI